MSYFRQRYNKLYLANKKQLPFPEAVCRDAIASHIKRYVSKTFSISHNGFSNSLINFGEFEFVMKKISIFAAEMYLENPNR